MSATSCPKCSSKRLSWRTVRKAVPIDLLQCADCGTVAEQEDWDAPLVPLQEGRCFNCGSGYAIDKCANCGLTAPECRQVHDELRVMIDPSLSLFDAARVAAKSGRRLLALKLATAAAATNEKGRGAVGRALRVQLLAAISSAEEALADARLWTQADKAAPAIAWAVLGQQYEATDVPGAAADAYNRALLLDPRQHPLRARRAHLLLRLNREGQALDEAVKVVELEGDEKSVQLALEAAEALCDRHKARYRDDEVARALELLGAAADRSAKLLMHRARLQAVEGDLPGARRTATAARRLDASVPIPDELNRDDGQKGSWWRWS